MKTKLFSLILLSFVLFTSCNKEKKELEKIKATADSLFKAGNFEEAKTYYSKILKSDPKNKEIQEKVNELNTFIETAQKEKEFQDLLQEADTFFENGNYEDAALAYEKLAEMNPEDTYVTDRLNESSAQLPAKADNMDASKPFHIIVGCFEINNNALRLQQKMLDKGRQSKLISIGRLTAVTYASYPTNRLAYSNLPNAKRDANQYDAWVMKYSK